MNKFQRVKFFTAFVCSCLFCSCEHNGIKVSTVNVSIDEYKELTKLKTHYNEIRIDSLTAYYKLANEKEHNYSIVVSFVKGADTLLSDTIPNRNLLPQIKMDVFNNKAFICWIPDSNIHLNNIASNDKKNQSLYLKIINLKNRNVLFDKLIYSSSGLELSGFIYNPFTQSALIAIQKNFVSSIIVYRQNKQLPEMFSYNVTDGNHSDNCSLSFCRTMSSVFSYYIFGNYWNGNKQIQRIVINKIDTSDICKPYVIVSDTCSSISNEIVMMNGNMFCQERFSGISNMPDTFIFKKIVIPEQ